MSGNQVTGELNARSIRVLEFMLAEATQALYDGREAAPDKATVVKAATGLANGVRTVASAIAAQARAERTVLKAVAEVKAALASSGTDKGMDDGMDDHAKCGEPGELDMEAFERKRAEVFGALDKILAGGAGCGIPAGPDVRGLAPDRGALGLEGEGRPDRELAAA